MRALMPLTFQVAIFIGRSSCAITFRHGRACHGHPRFFFPAQVVDGRNFARP
jgi:hypothetical protein